MARRNEARAALYDWLRSFGAEQKRVYGVGEDFAFDFPVELVKKGWMAWHFSGYKRKPTYEEIASRNPDWDSDLDLMESLYQHSQNDSVAMMVFRGRGGNNGEVLGVLPNADPGEE